MRIKLLHKLLGINVGIILVLTLVFVSLSYVASKSMYSNALNGIDLAVMEDLAATLSQEYAQKKSWDGWIQQKSEWNDTVNHSFYKVFFALMAEAAASSLNKEQRATPIPAPPPKSTPAWDMPFGTFLQRATLLDANKRVLIAPEIAKRDVNYQAIKLNGAIIGWLSIGKIDMDILPLAQYFFYQQLRVVNWSIALGGILAALLSFMFSRHITRPILALTQGAQQIAQRNFSTRIDIHSNDELQELAERFNTIATELALYHRQQKQWLTDISHELKTPLTLLVGEIFAICDNLTQRDENTAQNLQHEVLHIKRLVDDLYELSKGEEIGLRINRQTLDLKPFIEHLLTPYKPLFNERSILLEEVYNTDECFILADADRLTQVVRNLLENCLKYMDTPGRVRVDLSAQPHEVIIRLDDSGPGVSAEAATRMFDRLYRADTLTGRSGSGAGLGLAICKSIIDAHGGSIEASTSKLGGLAICIALPSFAAKNVTHV
ncbi:MAG TPA: ATP-binding protein [Cellvibrionaceae bacterium]|nr:ATP-binding protein [Cellvibrionaceae bacterium]